MFLLSPTLPATPDPHGGALFYTLCGNPKADCRDKVVGYLALAAIQWPLRAATALAPPLWRRMSGALLARRRTGQRSRYPGSAAGFSASCCRMLPVAAAAGLESGFHALPLATATTSAVTACDRRQIAAMAVEMAEPQRSDVHVRCVPVVWLVA